MEDKEKTKEELIKGIELLKRRITELEKLESEHKRAEDELKKRMHELERFQKFAVGRELKIVELKKRIKELEERLVVK